jgi:hypothetical protein
MMTLEEARGLVARAVGGEKEAKGTIGAIVDAARKGVAVAVHDGRLIAQAQRESVLAEHVARYSSRQKGNGEQGGPVNWGQARGGRG